MSNRLERETSPYLLQHKDNPVDWYPWGEEALNRAQAENKPILLSIGYSACHWCHVMAHESFENAGIARLMNENFISIKVDREERPDLDQIYQNVAQALTQGGGWPLTVFLTPQLKPYFGGTYFPPEDRYGRPGFPRVLQAMADAFGNDNAAVTENARRLTDYIENVEGGSAKAKADPRLPTIQNIATAVEELLGYMDMGNGGFGSAPKFPNPTALAFLWRAGGMWGSPECENARRAVILALRKMAEGGIYDQLGGGFHRYSVDQTWSVPHFEKMLYDNAQLLRLYSEALLDPRGGLEANDRELFTQVLRETVTYLLREMRSPEGGFFAAQDADSEGEEGKYFVWDPDDLKGALTAAEAEAFAKAYGVSSEGNFEHGKTVLFRAEEGGDPALLEAARAKLLAVRGKRIAPQTDTKVLASWNALAVSGLAWAARALDADPDPARTAYEFLRDKMGRDNDRLFATFQGGKPKGNAFLDDYAFLAAAALDLARFETDPKRQESLIGDCAAWLEVIQKHFRDAEGAGFFFTSDDHETLILRPKNWQDQAIPSGTAITVGCLVALSEIDWNGRGHEYYAAAERQLTALFPLMADNPFAASEFMSAAALFLKGPIVVSGPGASSAVVHAFIYQKPSQGKLLLCHQKACSAPYADVEALRNDVAAKLAALD